MSAATVPTLRAAPSRDPAWLGRVFWAGATLVVLWPLAVATEFKPWTLFDAANLKVTGQFLASFLPPAHSAEFLGMVARETWRTVAIATAGMTTHGPHLVLAGAQGLVLLGSTPDASTSPR